MRTDVVLQDVGRTTIVDTKYYAEALAERFGRESVRPGHLYQLFAYLANYPAVEGQALRGVLLYPRTTRTLGLAFQLHAWPVEVWTLDLAQAWPTIETDLLHIGGLSGA